MEKRGQVTTFVVIGIVILVIVAGLLAYKFWFVSGDLDSQLDLHSRLPEEVKPVAQVLDSCVNDLTRQGVDKLGISGGYIEAPEEKFLTNIFVPLSSNLEILPGLAVPVWFRERPTGEQVTNVPLKRDMEKQLGDYVVDNFDQCLLMLNDMNKYRFTSETTDIDIKVSILDETVDVIVDYPVNVKIKDVEFLLENHLGRSEVPLGRLYDNAVEIMEAENEGLFLEKKTIEMLIAYDEEVPYSGIDMECYEKVWSKTEVIARFKEILQSNVASLRVKGTSYTNVQDYFEVEALDDSDDDLSVSFMYSPSWPTYVEVEPSKGDVLQGDSMSKGTSGFMTSVLSSFFCLSSHHFIYDIKYPVLVTLKDKNTGYVFNFVTEVIIDNNQPRKNSFEPLLEDTGENIICDNPQADLDVGVKYYDASGNYKSLNGATVYYKCYPARCDLGDSTNGGLVARVPGCVNGIIEAEKEGFYRGKTYDVSTNTGELTSVDVVLDKIYTKDVKMLVIDKNSGEVRQPYDDEQVTFDFVNDNGFVGRASFPDDMVIDLVEGHYTVSSYVVGESTWPVTTPKETIKNCVDVNSGGVLGFFGRETEKCFEVEMESFELDYALKGGVDFEFDLEQSDLASGNDLTVYTMVNPVPGDLEGMMALSLAVEENDKDPAFKYPVI